MKNKITGLLGIAKRAGKILYGFDAVVSAQQTKKTVFIAVSSDVSENTLRKWDNLTDHAFLTHLPLTKDELSKALGSSKPVGILGITDNGFAKAIEKALQEI